MENQPCPACKEQGHDSNGDHLFLMTDGSRWCCSKTQYHSSNTYYFASVDDNGNPEHDRDKLEESTDKPEEATEASSFPSDEELDGSYSDSPFAVSDEPVADEDALAVRGFRGIPADQYGKYGVKCECDESSGEPKKFYYPLHTQCGAEVHKIRIVNPKDFLLSEKIGDRLLEFMGQNLYRGQKECLITEGQDDAITGDYIINSNRPKNMKVLVISVPNGANTKAFIDNREFLEKFDRLVFDPDTDEAGMKLLEKVAELFPSIKVLKKTEKDASDMFKEQKQEEYIRAYNTAKKFVPKSIVDLDEFLGTLKVPNEMGLSYPWTNVTETTYGMVPHTILSIGSGPGAGKTTVVRAIQQHLMFHHKKQVGIFSLEDTVAQALKYIVGYMMNERIHLPGATYDTKKAYTLGQSLRGKAEFFDNKAFEGEWLRIESAIRFMFSTGVEHFFIDPVSALIETLSSSDGNTALNAIYGRLKILTQDLPIYVMCVNHLNNPQTGTKHEDGGRVKPSQFTGSKAAWRASTEMWGCERNSNAEDPDERNIMTLRNLKHRIDGSKGGTADKLYFDKETGRQNEQPRGDPFGQPTGAVPMLPPKAKEPDASSSGTLEPTKTLSGIL